MKNIVNLPGKNGDVFVDREEVKAIIDIAAGRCSLVVGGKNVIVMAKAQEVADAIMGTRAAGPWKTYAKNKILDAPEEAGKELGQVGGVT